MIKELKKEIKKNICNPSGKYIKIMKIYLSEIEGTEKDLFISCYFKKKMGYKSVIRELNRHGYYLETTTFFRIKDEIITDVALRACYERIISPYSNEKSLTDKLTETNTKKV